jgi:hypothetical protein
MIELNDASIQTPTDCDPSLWFISKRLLASFSSNAN